MSVIQAGLQAQIAELEAAHHDTLCQLHRCIAERDRAEKVAERAVEARVHLEQHLATARAETEDWKQQAMLARDGFEALQIAIRVDAATNQDRARLITCAASSLVDGKTQLKLDDVVTGILAVIDEKVAVAKLGGK